MKYMHHFIQFNTFYETEYWIWKRLEEFSYFEQKKKKEFDKKGITSKKQCAKTKITKQLGEDYTPKQPLAG